ncbi:hypothetical protein HNR42_000465 [Deinobacterium chartae]|uniref:Uncharacterized protein n=1 Tax=Deinobacterium chartae TaxID=521158 RepID=A0A841HUD1_9DEIO|nr:hypothetical protein [Deinobacterium chartae]MBB6097051.1 hypothetical protein [Deinobacterium chartae]
MRITVTVSANDHQIPDGIVMTEEALEELTEDVAFRLAEQLSMQFSGHEVEVEVGDRSGVRVEADDMRAEHSDVDDLEDLEGDIEEQVMSLLERTWENTDWGQFSDQV